MKKLIKKIKNNIKKHLTAGRGEAEFSETRDILIPETRDIRSEMVETQKSQTLSAADSDFSFADNRELAGQVGPVGQNQEAQKDLWNLAAGHPVNQHNNHTRAFFDVETKNISEAAVKADDNQAALFRVLKNCLIVSADQAGLPHRQNFVIGNTQGRNQISMDAFIGKKAKHRGSSGFNLKQFFLAEDASRVIKGGLNIILGDAGILCRDFAYAVAGAQEMQNVGHGNARASYARLAEPHPLLNNNAVADIRRLSCNVLGHNQIG